MLGSPSRRQTSARENGVNRTPSFLARHGMGSLRISTSADSSTDRASSLTSALRSPSVRPETPTIDELSTEAIAGSIRFVPHVEFSSRLSLHFEPMERKLPNEIRIKVGRFNDKSQNRQAVTFKSKVVSRLHAEVWCTDGTWFIKDTKSSSGTFVNHIRLSPPGQESKPTILTDGDSVQFGIDFRGGTEEVYRCVRTRVEVNRVFQQNAEKYNRAAHKKLVSLTMAEGPRTPGSESTSRLGEGLDDNASTYTAECCICLFAIAPSQALFVAPCSHAYHFKCIRPLLLQNYPNFLCCVCRKYADLEASVEVESEAWMRSQTKECDPRTPITEDPEPVFQPLHAVISNHITNASQEVPTARTGPQASSEIEREGSNPNSSSINDDNALTTTDTLQDPPLASMTYENCGSQQNSAPMNIIHRQLRDFSSGAQNTPNNNVGPYLL